MGHWHQIEGQTKAANRDLSLYEVRPSRILRAANVTEKSRLQEKRMAIPNTREMTRRPTHPGEMLREDFLPDYGLAPD
jgi:hypothetical protein